MSPLSTEAQEQAALAAWLDLAVGRMGWCHVPNGGRRDPREAARMAGQGVKAGVPDLLIFRRPPLRPEARGVAIELKRRRGGRVSVEQCAWLAALDAEGWATTTARGWDEARAFLEGLGFGLGRARGQRA